MSDKKMWSFYDPIRTLQAKDEAKEVQLRHLQTQLDQARAEIKSLNTIIIKINALFKLKTDQRIQYNAGMRIYLETTGRNERKKREMRK